MNGIYYGNDLATTVHIDDGPAPPKQPRDLSLVEKLRESYAERYNDPEVSFIANVAAIIYFHFILHTEVYVTVYYVIPHLFDQYSEMFIYYMKVLAWFLYTETISNWLCLKFFKSSIPPDDGDRPTYEQMTLWERHVMRFQKEVPSHGPLAWRHCSLCNVHAPPRSHHCIVCNNCILKRDHHCYMTGVCVGYYNQRYFIVLVFYIAIGSLLGLATIFSYANDTFLPDTPWEDFVLPISVYKYFNGEVQHHHLFIIFHLCTLWWTGFTAVMFFGWQILIILMGKTNHEVMSRVNIRYTGSVNESFKSVFGAFWPVNFIFPAVILFRQEGNGSFWENLKT